MINCSKIAAGAAMASCRSTNPAILAEAVLINFDDWQGATITETGGVISAITLPSDTNGYKFESHEKSFDASYSMTRGTYVAAFSHQLIMRAFERTEAIKGLLNKMAHGRYVAIVRNVDIANAQTAYEVYGRENGLVASNIEFDSTNGDGVISAVTLASADGELESAVPTSVYTTSLAATKALVDGLLPD